MIFEAAFITVTIITSIISVVVAAHIIVIIIIIINIVVVVLSSSSSSLSSGRVSNTLTRRVVAVLERVQGGIIGQALSAFGITGLYITFVFGIGRFLRLSTQHMRMRIMYEDLPTTKRLVALCQVSNASV